MFHCYHSASVGNWMKGVIDLSLLFCWRPRRDLNPCYRRERDSGKRNWLKLKSTVGLKKDVLEPSGTLIEPLSNPRNRVSASDKSRVVTNQCRSTIARIASISSMC